MAVALATLVVTISFWAMGYGFVVGDQGTPGSPGSDASTTAGAAISLSLVLVPLAFAIAAWVSRRSDWPIGVLIAMGVSLAVGLPLLYFGDPLGSLLSGYAAGAVTSLSRPVGMGWRHRAVAAAVVTALVLLGNRFIPLVSLVFGPALPFTAMVVADMFVKVPEDPAEG
ncbi:MAG: hypothetical protein GEU79_12080 [Acidimicrobiia bacterium]|nr:hypothetical protein [Acidimicrobiia bacterium]